MLQKFYNKIKNFFEQQMQIGVQPHDNYFERRRKRTLNFIASFSLYFVTLIHFIRSIILWDMFSLLMDITLAFCLLHVFHLNRKQHYRAGITLWSIVSLLFLSINVIRAETQEPAAFGFLILSLVHYTLLSNDWKQRIFHVICFLFYIASTYYHRKYLPFSDLEFLPLIAITFLFYTILRYWENEHVHYQLNLEQQKEQIRQQKEELVTQNELLEVSQQKERALHQELLEAKDRELTTHTLSAVERQRLLQPTVEKLTELAKYLGKEEKKDLLEIRRVLQSHLDGKSWEQFLFHFENVHPSFFKSLQAQFPSLTNNDHKVCAYIKVGMGNQEIAQMIGITPASMKKNLNRLKKKLELGAEDSLRVFLMGV